LLLLYDWWFNYALIHVTTVVLIGLPLFCVSIGVVSKVSEQIVVGVIYNPLLDEMVYAVRGEGCYVNGEKILSGGEEKSIRLHEGLISVGFPGAKESTLRVASRAIGALATKAKGVRMIACASQVMSWVAQKKINAYVSWDLNSWDICAGMLIVEESGGYIRDMNGNKATIKSRDLIITCRGALTSNASIATNNSTSGSTGTEVRSGLHVPEAENSLHYELLKVLTENQCLTYD
jgi:fructose-1,6-bisphosphatase/inositol monophosphatase family enzyme